MEIWDQWLNLLQHIYNYFNIQIGISEASAIVLATVVIRVLLFPISFTAAYRSGINKYKLNRIKPQLDLIRKRNIDSPEKWARETSRLYKKEGIKFFDKFVISNVLAQVMVGFGMLRTILKTITHGKLLWIANIAKPDVILAVITGLTTFVLMAYTPASGEQIPMWFIVLPVMMTTVALFSMPSALGVYWATSNLFSIGQNAILRYALNRRKVAVSKSNKN